MKIAFVSPAIKNLFIDSSNSNFGGAEVQQKLLSERLIERGYEVSFLVAKAKDNSKLNISKSFNFIDFNLKSFGGSKFHFASDIFL